MQGDIQKQRQTQQADQENQRLELNFKEDVHELAHQERLRYLEPPISLPAKHYSLEPDYIGGWKPRKLSKTKYVNTFPIRYDEPFVDQVIKELVKNKNKYNEAVIYLGPRKNNSFLLHENRPYQNPYSSSRIQQIGGNRAGLPNQIELRTSYLRFNSDFECGNLDAVIQRSSDQFDLFMRVDTNTRGHTNWYYFEVYNDQFIGSVTFSICNFRRPCSLYQRGLKPYVWCKERKEVKWIQQGDNIRYEKQRLKYKFLYNRSQQLIDPMQLNSDKERLNTFYAMTFTYKFQTPHDTVKFAYCPPYTYTQLLHFLAPLSQYQIKSSLKSLTGLNIPLLKITSQENEDSAKKVVLITSRIHPGQSNSSYVAQGFIEFLCSNEAVAKDLKEKYIFYVVPMLNPDGVVAGNYRTSLFGKDLNRTFDQERRFAFPQIYKLLRFAQQLKKTHKKRFCLYIDLHGHSIKKNIFMYGPDYSIQDMNYQVCRQLPKILGNATQLFRYYSCTFRISDAKASTGRAVFNRTLKIPYTYTMESSNGCYLDYATHNQVPFTIAKWRQMGISLAKGLNVLKLQKNPKITRTNTEKISKKYYYSQNNIGVDVDRISDDDINEKDSDMEPQNQDLPDEILQEIQCAVQGKSKKDIQEKQVPLQQSPNLEIPPHHTEEKKPKKKPQLNFELSKRQGKNDVRPAEAKEVCAFQIPQRKNISFPTIYRGQIFASRQSRHQKYELPLQARIRKNESQIYKTLQTKNKNKPLSQNERKLPWQSISKKQVNLSELVKRYKFNF